MKTKIEKWLPQIALAASAIYIAIYASYLMVGSSVACWWNTVWMVWRGGW